VSCVAGCTVWSAGTRSPPIAISIPRSESKRERSSPIGRQRSDHGVLPTQADRAVLRCARHRSGGAEGGTDELTPPLGDCATRGTRDRVPALSQRTLPERCRRSNRNHGRRPGTPCTGTLNSQWDRDIRDGQERLAGNLALLERVRGTGLQPNPMRQCDCHRHGGGGGESRLQEPGGVVIRLVTSVRAVVGDVAIDGSGIRRPARIAWQ
jgi:hypothetical protein